MNNLKLALWTLGRTPWLLVLRQVGMTVLIGGVIALAGTLVWERPRVDPMQALRYE